MLKNWFDIKTTGFHTFVFSNLEGLLRLQNIFNDIPVNSFGADLFRIKSARKISSASDAIEYLQLMEKVNRHTLKHIILDCSAELAMKILISHVRSVQLGR